MNPMSRDGKQPPRLAQRLLQRYCPLGMREVVEGDLEERYQKYHSQGAMRADVWYWKEVLLMCWWHGRTNNDFDQAWGPIMFRNYLTVAWRHLLKHKGYSFINVAGLATGMACFLLILLYVQHEQSYDQAHPNVDRLYRLVYDNTKGGGTTPWAITKAEWSRILPESLAEIEEGVSIIPTFGFNSLVEYEDKRFLEERFLWADSSLLRLFDLDLIQGDKATALREPYTIVIPERTAKKYFGNVDPMGKVLRRDNESDYRITGVLADPPENMHFHFDFVASSTSAGDDWDIFWAYTYLLLRPGADPGVVQAQFRDQIRTHLGEERAQKLDFTLQPVTDIHLRSNLLYEYEANSDIAYVYILLGVAVFILVIACVNFMNLSTARSAHRAKEVGLRKVVGAHRSQLIRQYLSESLLLSLIALMLAVVLVQLLLPVFNSLVDKNLVLDYFDNRTMLLCLVGTALFVGLFAGSYPAFFLSRFRPVSVLKGTFRLGSQGAFLRKGLVVVQFALSIMLIAGTVVVQDQVAYFKEKKLGFNKEQVVAIPIARTEAIPRQYEAFKDALLQHPNIEAVSGMSNIPGQIEQMFVGTVRVEGAQDAEGVYLSFFRADEDFIRTLDVQLLEGRDFSADFPADSVSSVIINETAMRQFGWQTPQEALGKRLDSVSGDYKRTIIGVVQDFHFASLHSPIGPLLIHWESVKRYNTIGVRLRTTELVQTLAFIETTWDRFEPGRPLESFMMDSYFDAQYQKEEKMASLISVFSFLAIVIACLGLFGLAAFTAEQRTKEIGVRKVLGASIHQVTVLLSQSFVRLVGIAFVVSTPIAYVALNRWLEDFAYHIDLGVGTFMLAGALALVVALVTVGYQAIRAAVANPIDALRYE